MSSRRRISYDESPLPAGYLECEYIESTLNSSTGFGNQYINSGINANGNLSLYIDVMATSHSMNNDGFALFGSRTGSRYYLAFTNYINTSSYSHRGIVDYNMTRRYDSEPSSTGGIDLVGERHTYMMTPTGYYFDNNKVLNWSSASFTGISIYVFELNDNWSERGLRYIGRLYKCWIKDGDTLVRDYVPALRSSDSVVGLYDLVSNQFFKSATNYNFNYKIK